MADRRPPKGGLRFVGDGTRYLHGVPARDLTHEEAERHWARVKDSDLYQPEAASASAANEKADTRKE